MEDESAISEPKTEEDFIREWKDACKKGYQHLVPITANRLRTGKTLAGLRIGELLDPHFGIENVGFDTEWYVETADKVERDSILVLDEPNRAAGNRNWYTEENRGFAEYLQTNAYRGVHGLFPLPHQHLMDNAVMGVCTAQLVMWDRGFGTVYIYDRDQLNRSYSTYTNTWGDLYLDEPDVKLKHQYEKARDEYTRARNKEFLKRLKANREIALQPAKRDISKEIEANIESFKEGGKVSGAIIEAYYEIGRNKAYSIAKKLNMKARVISLSP